MSNDIKKMVCRGCIHNKICPDDKSIIRTIYDEDGFIDYNECPDYIDDYDANEARKAGDGENDNTFIKIEGCDDSTIFAMELTESEFDFLRRVSEKANKVSTYCCMPRLFVAPLSKTKGETDDDKETN